MELELDLKNCHGIKSLSSNILFNDNNNTAVIHSSNGIMKTSLCKTLNDIHLGQETHDELNMTAEVKRLVSIDGKPIDPTSIYVMNANSNKNEDLNENVSSALMDETLRQKYLKAQSSYNEATNNIIKALSKDLHINEDKTKEILLNYYTNRESDINKQFTRLERNIRKKKKFINIKSDYNTLFSTTAINTAKDRVFNTNIKYYSRLYKKMIKKSLIFTDKVFDLNNLQNIAQSLEENNFFDGKNSINLNGIKEPIQDLETLKKIIQREVASINKKPEMQKAFTSIEKAFNTNKTTKRIAALLKTDIDYCRGFSNIEQLRKNYLAAVIYSHIDELHFINEQYTKSLKEIKAIIIEAKKEKTQWEDIIKTFNRRFDMPYELRIINKKNAILGMNGMTLFFDNKIGSQLEPSLLDEKIFSNGEKLAYHLLDIIFKIETLRKTNNNYLLVFDDIADSFDYTNKHAIVEYINDLSKEKKFSLLILTHNFDFYRSVGSRICGYKNSYFATKQEDSSVKILQGNYLKNFFLDGLMKTLKNGSSDDDKIAAIPFARGLVEMSSEDYQNDKNYLLFTRLMHYRPNGSAHIKMKTVLEKIESVLNIKAKPSESDDSVYHLIMKRASILSTQHVVNQNLSEKIVLALALRIRAEKYIYERLLNKKIIKPEDMNHKECGELFGCFKEKIKRCVRAKSTLESIVLITPEEMHLNAFMYEPLIDFSIHRLRTLFIQFNECQKDLFDVIF